MNVNKPGRIGSELHLRERTASLLIGGYKILIADVREPVPVPTKSPAICIDACKRQDR